jgi:hypothetical protein
MPTPMERSLYPEWQRRSGQATNEEEGALHTRRLSLCMSNLEVEVVNSECREL